MKRFLAFLRTTLVGGFLGVLPVVLLVLVLTETVDLVRLMTDPLVEMLDIEDLVGAETALLVSILVLALLCFLAGLVQASTIGSRFAAFLERNLLERIPGYGLIKGVTTNFVTVGAKSRFAVALVDLYGDGTRVLGFIVDELPDSSCAIFVPNAPNPASGTVYFVARDRVERLAVPMGTAVNRLMQWGVDSAQMLPRR